MRTKGLIEAYFTSKYFMKESQDVLGFKNIYHLDTTLIEASAFTESNLEDMSYSLWYVERSEDTLRKYIDILDEKARAYIANNRELIGKVSDDHFYNYIHSLCQSVDLKLHNKEVQKMCMGLLLLYYKELDFYYHTQYP